MLDNPIVWAFAIGGPLITFLMGGGAVATWWERRFAGKMQTRFGPNRVGPQGILQPVADAFKMMQKEDIVPRAADRTLFNLAPIFPPFLVIASAAVIPFAATVDATGKYDPTGAVAELDIGILWVLSMAGLMVFPIWVAGWSANNKYTLLSGMRMVAQGISYEIPMVLCALIPVIYAGSLSLSDIVAYQHEHGWIALSLSPSMFVGAAAMLLFFLTSLAEANRIPFDIPEAESELIAGVMVEYTGIKFGIFMLAEYLHTIVAAALTSALFLGGPSPLFGPAGPIAGLIWMLGKTLVLFVLIYWLRWSLYRFRSDQLMDLCWKVLVPMSLLLVMLAALMVAGGFA
ncbi:MAG: NADH-quinone oxidoreductase subunit H [Deltaproteobacteria bacterium]|nr:MAG: NADH-quinone oxidoreductase subunit H [Deltaproteobacteria bacterium]